MLPAPRSPDGRTIREDHPIHAGCVDAESIMPVTDPIESTFATVRLRTVTTKGRLSRRTAPAMVFRLGQLIAGVRFGDGEPIQATEAQAAA